MKAGPNTSPQAICHATTVLAWAQVNGVSPIQGKTVSVPYGGSPGVFWNGQNYNPEQSVQLHGGLGDDWILVQGNDYYYEPSPFDLLTSYLQARGNTAGSELLVP